MAPRDAFFLKLLIFGSLLTAEALRTATMSYAAMGDSYAAGDGAGSSKLLPNFDLTCGRFDEAYPVQVVNSSRINVPSGNFANVACGGHSSLTVLQDQVPHIGHSDFVTLTVGGNEVDFFLVLNACVHEWYPSTSSCQDEVDKAKGLILSNEFVTNYNRLIAEALKHMKPDARLLVTGYAKFFNEKTNQCNHVSFSRRNPWNFLSKERRKILNDMVNMVNDVIRASAETHGPRAEYVDVDRLFEGHRFCEKGVVEPSFSDNTWFFNIGSAKDDTIWQSRHTAEQNSLPGPIEDFFDLTRTFHPTGLGHRTIAKDIVSRMLN